MMNNTVKFSAQFTSASKAAAFVNAIKDNFMATINENVVTINDSIPIVVASNLTKTANMFAVMRVQF